MSESVLTNNILLVKIGGSSITEKAELETLNTKALEWFSRAIRSAIDDAFLSRSASRSASASEEESATTNGGGGGVGTTGTTNEIKPLSIIVVHGAGSFGHHTAKQYGLGGTTSPPPDGMRLTRDLVTGIARTRQSVKKLNGAVVSELIESGVNAVGISPCFNVPGLMTHGGDEHHGATLLVESILDTLSAGLVPVLHGDAGLYGTYSDHASTATATETATETTTKTTATTTTMGNRDHRHRFRSLSAGILGGDTLVELIATHPLMEGSIDRTIFLTDVDGVFTHDPKMRPNAELVRNVRVDPVSGRVMNELSASGSSHEHDVTGGLKAKLGAAATVAKTGIDVIIARCGSVGATTAMSERVSDRNAPNTGDYTVVRKYQPA
mmetsp:Transcript_2220/g.5944  ORF Transcript_2220/g.5944 Transcript_2220/m.5944 type:complete len:382 (-) Transcript_2220:101-1246(-)